MFISGIRLVTNSNSKKDILIVDNILVNIHIFLHVYYDSILLVYCMQPFRNRMKYPEYDADVRVHINERATT